MIDRPDIRYIGVADIAERGCIEGVLGHFVLQPVVKAAEWVNSEIFVHLSSLVEKSFTVDGQIRGTQRVACDSAVRIEVATRPASRATIIVGQRGTVEPGRVVAPLNGVKLSSDALQAGRVVPLAAAKPCSAV